MPADQGTTGRNPAPRRRKRQRTDDTVRQLSLQEARAEAQARRQAREAEDYHREQALRENAPAGRAKVRAKPGLETPNARPRDYTHPVNPYRPTPQEARAARAQLEQQRLEANLIPLSPAMRLAGNFTRGAGEAYLGFVPGVVQTSRAVAADVGKGDPGFGTFRREIGGPIVDSYRHTYGPAFHGDFNETRKRIAADPFGPVMDAWTLATFGAAGATKAGLLSKTAREAGITVDGGTVSRYTSPNPLARRVENRYNRYSEAHPDRRFIGAKTRAEKNIRQQGQIDLEREQATLIPFSRVAAKLRKRPAQNMAYHVIADYGDQAVARIDKEIEFRRSQPRTAAQTGQIVLLKAARKHVQNPSKLLQQALEQGRKVTDEATGTLIDLGELTPEGAANKLRQHSRIIEGARFVTPEEAATRVKRIDAAIGRIEGKQAAMEKRTRMVGGEVRTAARAAAAADRLAERMSGRRAKTERSRRRADALKERIAVEEENLARMHVEGYEVTGGKEFAPLVRQQDLVASLRNQYERIASAAVRHREAEIGGLEAVEKQAKTADALNAARDARLAKLKEQRAAVLDMDETLGRLAALRENVEATAGRLVGAENVRAGEGAFYMWDTPRRPVVSGFRKTRSVTGKAKPVVYQSQGILFTLGQIRRGAQITLEHAQRVKRKRMQLADSDQIAAEWARPLEPTTWNPSGLLNTKDWVFFNPTGYQIERRFRNNFLDELTPKELGAAVDGDYKEMLSNVFPESQASLPRGMEDRVLQVPKWVKDAYETDGRIAIPGKLGDGAKLLGEAFDLTNNIARLGMIYLKPGYFAANFTANELLAIVQQGVFHPVNLAIASGIMGKLPTNLLKRLDVEVGSGGALAVAGEGRGLVGNVVSAVAHVQNVAADRLPRRTAIIHELRKNGYKTEKQITDLLNDQSKRPLLNTMALDAENAMVRFRGLSPLEQQIVSRAIFVYPWVKGSTRYAVRLPWDHPMKANVIAHIGTEGWDDLRAKIGQVASFLRTRTPIGAVEKNAVGNLFAKVVSPDPASPFGTSVELMEAARGALTGEASPKDLGSFASPPIRAAVETLWNFDTFAGHPLPAEERGLKRAALRQVEHMSPVMMAKGILGDLPPSKYYADDPNAAAIGTWGLSSLYYPRTLDVTAGRKAGKKEFRENVGAKGRAKVDLADSNKAIDQAVKRGQIDEAGAKMMRDQAKAGYVAALREKQLKDKGLHDAALQRQYMIDAVAQGQLPLSDANTVLAQTGGEPFTQEDVDDAHDELLELAAAN